MGEPCSNTLGFTEPTRMNGEDVSATDAQQQWESCQDPSAPQSRFQGSAHDCPRVGIASVAQHAPSPSITTRRRSKSDAPKMVSKVHADFVHIRAVSTRPRPSLVVTLPTLQRPLAVPSIRHGVSESELLHQIGTRPHDYTSETALSQASNSANATPQRVVRARGHFSPMRTYQGGAVPISTHRSFPPSASHQLQYDPMSLLPMGSPAASPLFNMPQHHSQQPTLPYQTQFSPQHQPHQGFNPSVAQHVPPTPAHSAPMDSPSFYRSPSHNSYLSSSMPQQPQQSDASLLRQAPFIAAPTTHFNGSMAGMLPHHRQFNTHAQPHNFEQVEPSQPLNTIGESASSVLPSQFHFSQSLPISQQPLPSFPINHAGIDSAFPAGQLSPRDQQQLLSSFSHSPAFAPSGVPYNHATTLSLSNQDQRLHSLQSSVSANHLPMMPDHDLNFSRFSSAPAPAPAPSPCYSQPQRSLTDGYAIPYQPPFPGHPAQADHQHIPAPISANNYLPNSEHSSRPLDAANLHQQADLQFFNQQPQPLSLLSHHLPQLAQPLMETMPRTPSVHHAHRRQPHTPSTPPLGGLSLSPDEMATHPHPLRSIDSIHSFTTQSLHRHGSSFSMPDYDDYLHERDSTPRVDHPDAPATPGPGVSSHSQRLHEERARCQSQPQLALLAEWVETLINDVFGWVTACQREWIKAVNFSVKDRSTKAYDSRYRTVEEKLKQVKDAFHGEVLLAAKQIAFSSSASSQSSHRQFARVELTQNLHSLHRMALAGLVRVCDEGVLLERLFNKGAIQVPLATGVSYVVGQYVGIATRQRDADSNDHDSSKNDSQPTAAAASPLQGPPPASLQQSSLDVVLNAINRDSKITRTDTMPAMAPTRHTETPSTPWVHSSPIPVAAPSNRDPVSSSSLPSHAPPPTHPRRSRSRSSHHRTAPHIPDFGPSPIRPATSSTSARATIRSDSSLAACSARQVLSSSLHMDADAAHYASMVQHSLNSLLSSSSFRDDASAPTAHHSASALHTPADMRHDPSATSAHPVHASWGQSCDMMMVHSAMSFSELDTDHGMAAVGAVEGAAGAAPSHNRDLAAHDYQPPRLTSDSSSSSLLLDSGLSQSLGSASAAPCMRDMDGPCDDDAINSPCRQGYGGPSAVVDALCGARLIEPGRASQHCGVKMHGVPTEEMADHGSQQPIDHEFMTDESECWRFTREMMSAPD